MAYLILLLKDDIMKDKAIFAVDLANKKKRAIKPASCSHRTNDNTATIKIKGITINA